MPDNCFKKLKKQQVQDWFRPEECGVSDASFCQVFKQLDEYRCGWSDELGHYAYLLALAFGWTLAPFFPLQFGFQHNIYQFHNDGAGKISLTHNENGFIDGDGWGQQIATFQFDGPDAEVYLAGSALGHGDVGTHLGVKFQVGPGWAWGISGHARFAVDDGVIPCHVMRDKHHTEKCTACRFTVTLRNGMVTRQQLEMKRMFAPSGIIP